MTRLRASRFRGLLFLLPSLLGAAAFAQELPAGCRTPREAVASVFAWQQPEHFNAENAARCLEAPGLPAAERAQLAAKVKRLFDAKLALIDLESLSDDAAYKGSSDRARVVPHRSLPTVVVEKRGDQWLWTRASLDEVVRLTDELHLNDGLKLVERMPKSLKGTLFDVALWQYLALLLTLLVGLIARKVLQVVVLQRVRTTGQLLKQRWAVKLVDVIASPGATLVIAALLKFVTPALELPVRAGLAVDVAVRLLVVASLVWAAYRMVDVIAERMAQRAEETETRLDDQLVPLVRKSLKVMTVIVGALFMLQNMNLDVGSLLAGLGIGGLALALAAQDTVSNFFGSVMIFVDRPFQIGDWVVVGDVEGVVEEVGFRSTRIRTFYNSLVTVPNNKLMQANIDNYGAREYRRTTTTLNVSYDTTPEQLEAFCDGIRAIIQANPFTRKDYYEIHFQGFGAHSLDVMLYFFFKVRSWTEELRQRHLVYLEILRLAKALDVVFAYPTQTLQHEFLHAPSEPRPKPRVPNDEALAKAVTSFGPGGEAARPKGPHLTDGFYAKDEVPPPAPSGG